ncbi:MAG: class I SAM-dependent methyltransferase [Hyphomonadaceae bacterium]|nr:class I SAM-dependent methyltransferase [Hyphomonadaceae bacterium]
MDQRFVGRLYRRVVHKYFANDLMLELKLRSRREACDYIQSHLKTALLFEDRYEQLSYALAKGRAAIPGGLVCEFGVAGGRSIRHIAREHGGLVHGFDTFTGLPQDWTGTNEQAGAFAKRKPPRVPHNVVLHEGSFSESIPAFLETYKEPAAFLHLDADLYESTKTVLTLLRRRIVPGTVLVFDEYHNYPSWREHEYKAFQEFVSENGHNYNYIGFSTLRGEVAAQIA